MGMQKISPYYICMIAVLCSVDRTIQEPIITPLPPHPHYCNLNPLSRME